MLLLLLLPAAQAGRCSLLAGAADSIAAVRLEGNWTFQPELTEWLAAPGKYAQESPVGALVLSFVSDPAVLSDMPQQNCAFLQERGLGILAAGLLRFYHIEFGLTEQRYLVTTSTAGDLALLYWQSGLLAPVYKRLSLVPALIPAQDLLFLGGDSMTVEWSALSRLATSSRLCQ